MNVCGGMRASCDDGAGEAVRSYDVDGAVVSSDSCVRLVLSSVSRFTTYNINIRCVQCGVYVLLGNFTRNELKM